MPYAPLLLRVGVVFNVLTHDQSKPYSGTIETVPDLHSDKGLFPFGDKQKSGNCKVLIFLRV